MNRAPKTSNQIYNAPARASSWSNFLAGKSYPQTRRRVNWRLQHKVPSDKHLQVTRQRSRQARKVTSILEILFWGHRIVGRTERVESPLMMKYIESGRTSDCPDVHGRGRHLPTLSSVQQLEPNEHSEALSRRPIIASATFANLSFSSQPGLFL